MSVRYPVSLRNVEHLLLERGYDFCHETVRHWWNRFEPMFAVEIRRRILDPVVVSQSPPLLTFWQPITFFAALKDAIPSVMNLLLKP